MRGEQAARVFILALFALCCYLLYIIVKPFLTGFAWAAFLAIAFSPVYSFLSRAMRGRKILASIATTLLVSALVLVPAIVLVSSLAAAALEYLPSLEAHLGTGTAEALAAKTMDAGGAALEPGPLQAPASSRDLDAEAGVGGTETGTPRSSGPDPGALPGGISTAGADADGTGSPHAGGKVAGSSPLDRAENGSAGRVHFPFLHRIETVLSRFVDPSSVDLEGWAASLLKNLASVVAQRSTGFLGDVLGFLTTILITLVMLAIFLIKGENLVVFARAYMPLSEEDKNVVIEDLFMTTRAIFYGVMMTAAIQATCGGVGWAIAGLSSAVVAGVAMFFCALLPIGGAALVWLPGAIWLIVQGHPYRGTFLLVWGIVCVSSLDNILRPIFISGRTKVPMLPVLLGILGGVAAFGMTGLFVGPLVVTLFLTLLQVIRRDFFRQDAPPPAPPQPSG